MRVTNTFFLAVTVGSSGAVCAPSYPRQSNTTLNAVPSYVKTYGINKSYPEDWCTIVLILL